MHCTVKPGKYCIFLPQWPEAQVDSRTDGSRLRQKKSEVPKSAKFRGVPSSISDRIVSDARSKSRQGRAGTVQMMGRILALENCGVKRKDYKILW
jgi:hypothetical protein